ncbi:hypothetical protein [Buchnera aphidicola]|uniref:hypothetical protein n=1 Tax=Buchnera aphidicola TaxID=9 RepID=UPI002AA29F98|nr:hypothetical protein [Buchnera aphidicola]
MIQKKPRICDPNRRNQDRYLFLETILSIKKYLYISYIGEKKSLSSKNYPSILLEELINYITNNFYLLEKERKKSNKNSKDVFSFLCHLHTKTGFDIKNFVKNNHYQSFDVTWLKIINSKKNKKYTFIKPTPHIIKKDINFKNFISFWNNPIRYFFHNQLNIQLNSNKFKITENFQPSALDIYKIRLHITKKLIENKDTSNIFQYFTDVGLLSNDNFSFSFLEKQKEKIVSLAKKIYVINTLPVIKKNFCIKIHNYCLRGSLYEIHNVGLVRWKPKILHLNDSMQLWLEHLIYCYLGGKEKSTILGINNSKWNFYNMEKEEAYRHIEKYVSGYIEGLKKPLLLIKSGANWINIIYDKINKKIILDNKTKNKGYEKMLSTWHGNQYHIGEKYDPYIKKIIPILNENYINDIYQISKFWWIPILNYQLIN